MKVTHTTERTHTFTVHDKSGPQCLSGYHDDHTALRDRYRVTEVVLALGAFGEGGVDLTVRGDKLTREGGERRVPSNQVIYGEDVERAAWDVIREADPQLYEQYVPEAIVAERQRVEAMLEALRAKS